MSDGWPTNDALTTLYSRLYNAAERAYQADHAFDEHGDPLAKGDFILLPFGFPEDVIANDPAAINDLFDGYKRIQNEIPLLDEQSLFDEIDHELRSSWTGGAASNFRTHLGTVQNFLNDQALHFEEMKGCINGAYLLSVEARKSYPIHS